MALSPGVDRSIWCCLRKHLPRQISTTIPHQLNIQCARRNMSTNKSTNSVPHELRTASEPRQVSLYSVRLSKVTQVNPTIRLLQLTLPSDQSTSNGSEVRKYLPQPLYMPHFYIHVPPILYFPILPVRARETMLIPLSTYPATLAVVQVPTRPMA